MWTVASTGYIGWRTVCTLGVSLNTCTCVVVYTILLCLKLVIVYRKFRAISRTGVLTTEVTNGE